MPYPQFIDWNIARKIGLLPASSSASMSLEEWFQTVQGSGGAAQVGFIQSGAGAIATDLQTRGRTVIYANDFLPLGYVKDGSVDYTSQVANVLTALPTGGGEIRWPRGRFKFNATVTQFGVKFKGEAFARNSAVNTQFIPAVLANPTLAVGDGTTLCTGFQLDGIALEGSGTGAIGLKINGATVCIYRNFSSQGFTDASVRITSSATQATDYQFFDGFNISANPSASSIGLDVIYGSQFSTALYFSNGTIGAQTTSKYTYQVTGAVDPVFSNVWLNIGGSGVGGSHVTSGGVMGKILCYGLTFDSPTSTDVLVTFDANQLPSDYVRGYFNIDGKISMPGGSTVALGAGNPNTATLSTLLGSYPFLNRPQIGSEIDFLYRANVWNEFDQVNDGKCRIYRDVNGSLLLDTAGSSGTGNIWLKPGSGNIDLLNTGGIITLQFSGSAGTSTIAQGAGDLVLTPVSGQRIQISGGDLAMASGHAIQADNQTTVGAAGGASALPATPTGYAKLISKSGIIYVVPFYAAA